VGSLLGCQGQVRLAPTGHVVGIHMDAALKNGAVRACDLQCSRSCCPRPRPDWSRRCPSTEVGVITI
jgi:hypothetical protein